MIRGFEVGTEVKWNENNTLTTGVIKVAYRQSFTVELDGNLFDIKVSKNSPSYLIRTADSELVVLPHTAVTRHHSNLHT